VTIDKIIAAAQELVKGKAPVPHRPTGAPAAGETIARATRAVKLPGIEEPVAAAAPLTRDSARASAQPATGVPVMMPNQDLTVTEGTVVRWLKQVGDSVALNEIIVEVETAKAVVAVESPAAGTLAEVLAEEGAIIQMGQPLATIQPG
jgi:2-oxoisovalerate dehydrogenase E1 component